MAAKWVHAAHGAAVVRPRTVSGMDAMQLVRVRALARSGDARRVRQAAALTRTEVARSIGVSHAAVSRWESGTRVPQGAPAIRYLRLLERLAAATGQPLDTGPVSVPAAAGAHTRIGCPA